MAEDLHVAFGRLQGIAGGRSLGDMKLSAWLLLLALVPTAAWSADSGAWFFRQDAALAGRLASRHSPTPEGALGRNRGGYFHARFQVGVHQLAYRALQQRDPDTADAALRAIDYAFRHAAGDGGFEVVVPHALRAQPAPSAADLASGTAFFLASAGPALWLLDDGAPGHAATWLPQTQRDRRDALRPALRRALAYLKTHQSKLQHADARAPNRLLFNALAFRSLGVLLQDAAALDTARGFIGAALALQSPEGYFVEGGGFDSSYNGVAVAVGYRLLAMDPEDPALASALAQASDWQAGRIARDGAISTQGNARVYPGGEHFLGKAKAVDAAHTVEAMMLAAAQRDDPRLLDAARRVADFYGSR
jgi:hypothetical protein